MKNKLVRTRYAPSPTGLFHIGGARTALFNYVFAKAYGGSFILRIEDTDIDRNVDNGIDSQIKNLSWLKIFPDESINNPGLYGPYIQSEKLSRYKDLANMLLYENKAYRCFCKANDLKKDREKNLKNKNTPKYSGKCKNLSVKEIQKNLFEKKEFVLRLNIQEKDYEWNDLVKGLISIPSSALSDIIILKSNGYPTYNFAVSIDDYDMEITHILRGEEHISNTPYQIAIKESLNFLNEIQYGHLPVIIDSSGKKLSKRNLEIKQFIEDYKNMGFPSKAIINYMCLLGWTPKENNEIFNINYVINEFDLEGITSSPSAFDFKKMQWISKIYFKNMDEIEYIDFVTPFVNVDNAVFKKNTNFCLLLFKDQISYASELNDLILGILKFDKLSKEEIFKIVNKYGLDSIKEINNFRINLSKIDDWNLETIKFIVNDVAENSSLNIKDFYPYIRIACTFKSYGPEIYKIIFLLGKEIVCQNLKYFINSIEPKKSKTINFNKVVNNVK